MIEKLSTIQKQNRLNDIIPLEQNRSSPCSCYAITMADDHDMVLQTVKFQRGPRKDPGAQRGVLEGDLLEIVRDRLAAHQAGPYACRENAIALTHVEEALLWMAKRADDRAERGVLGTNRK